VHKLEIDIVESTVRREPHRFTYGLRLIAEDAPIFDSIRFERGCLTRSDEFLTVGMKYVDSFPEARPAAGLFD
jgi:hypothetical protein